MDDIETPIGGMIHHERSGDKNGYFKRHSGGMLEVQEQIGSTRNRRLVHLRNVGEKWNTLCPMENITRKLMPRECIN